MKLSSSAVEIKSTAPLASQGFSVRKQDMHIILDMFRSKLYKDPIMAVCREYMCNARDAHREVNTPERPIEITLPSPLNCQLLIQDFGPGISPRRMGDIFLNYGASTKRRSNKQTGAFGIGGKSGFAISDTFSIISIFGGVKRHYTAFNDGRSGGVDLVNQEETTEPNGTTIVIPIKPEDMNRVAEAVVKTCTYWDVRPIIHNMSYAVANFPNLKDSLLLEGDDWKVYSKDNVSYYISNAKVIVDGIPYPVTYEDLGVKTEWVKTLLSRRVDLYFKTGMLALVPSRDNLLFDNKTIKRIVQRLDKVNDALYKNAVEKVATCKTLLEAELFWQEFRNTMLTKNGNLPVWNGIELKGTARPVQSSDGVIVKRFNWVNKTRRSKHASEPKFVSETVSRYNLGNEIKIVWNDTDRVKGFYDKIKELLKTYKLVYFISGPNVFNWAKEHHLNELEAIRASSLPDLSKNDGSGKTYRGSSVKKEVIDCWVFDRKYTGENKDHESGWRPTTIQKFLDSGVYISSINKVAQEYDSPVLKLSRYSEISLIAKACELQDKQLYLVPRRLVKFLGPMWKELESVAIPIVTKILTETTPEYINMLKGAEKYRLENVSSYRVNKLRDVALKSPNSLLSKYIQTSDLLKKEIENLELASELNMYFSYRLKLAGKDSGTQAPETPEIVTKLKDQLDLLNKEYPLLLGEGCTADSLLQYIEAINQLKKPALKLVGPVSVENDEPERYCALV